MTVTRSASGTRIDCDQCNDYASSPRLAVDVLRCATGYVHHDSRDYCPACWETHTVTPMRTGSAGSRWDGSSAA